MTIVPLTERVLNRLGSPRLPWILLWAGLLVFAYAAAYLAKSPVYVGLPYAAVSVYVNLLALLVVGVIARRVEPLLPSLSNLLGREEMERLQPFARLSSIWGPLILSLVAGYLWEVRDLFQHPGALTTVLSAIIILGWIPANAGLWVIGIILLDLDRIGRSRLHLTPFEDDRTLGLRPLGSLAVTAFVLVSAGFVPLAIVGATDAMTLVATLGLYFIITLLFVLSLWRLHNHLVRAKAQHVTEARNLYADALHMVRAAWTQDARGDQAVARLNAAEAIERRASAVHEWPLGEGMVGRVAAIFSAVVTGILVRVILASVGL